MDNIIVTCTDQRFISHLIGAHSTEFSLQNLFTMHYFLGIKVLPHSPRIIISQQKYISNLLQKANLSDAQLVTTPLSTSASLTKLSGPSFSDPTQYDQVVDAVKYITLTSPDFEYF